MVGSLAHNGDYSNIRVAQVDAQDDVRTIWLGSRTGYLTGGDIC